MLNKLHFLLATLFLITWNLNAQNTPQISGEINTRASIRLDSSQQVWSRSTFRLKLDSEISEKVHAFANVKMYSTKNAGFDWKLNEAYMDYYGSSYDLRAGVQIINWGTAWMINPTNNINPFDLSEEVALIPEDRLGVTAFQLKYYPVNNLIFRGVYIPYFIPALEVPDVPLPEKNLKNSEYALKLTAQSIMGFDLSASYFKGKEDIPRTNGCYRDVQIYGADFIGSIGEVALWAEGGYSVPDTGKDSYEITAGGEYTFGDDLYFMMQCYHINSGLTREYYLMSVLRYPIMDLHTLQLGFACEPEKKIYVFYPEVTLSPDDALSIALSGIYVNGDTEETFMSFIRNRIFIKLEYFF